MRARYCKCKNTYTIKECDCPNVPEYWKQGIGITVGQNDLGAFSDDFNNDFDI